MNNYEFIEKMAEGAFVTGGPYDSHIRQNPLLPVFIIEAIHAYARQIEQAPEGFMENHIISEEVWREVSAYTKRCIDDRVELVRQHTKTGDNRLKPVTNTVGVPGSADRIDLALQRFPKCPVCSTENPAHTIDQSDPANVKEFTISGLCQDCQNSVFAEPAE